MASRLAKFARLENLRRSTPYVSQNALEGIIADIKEHGLPEVSSRASMQRATQESLQKHHCYGPLLEEHCFAKNDGGQCVALLTNVGTYLAALYGTKSYRELLCRVHQREPSSYDAPWGLIIYSDELCPGNPLGRS